MVSFDPCLFSFLTLAAAVVILCLLAWLDSLPARPIDDQAATGNGNAVGGWGNQAFATDACGRCGERRRPGSRCCGRCGSSRIANADVCGACAGRVDPVTRVCQDCDRSPHEARARFDSKSGDKL